MYPSTDSTEVIFNKWTVIMINRPMYPSSDSTEVIFNKRTLIYD